MIRIIPVLLIILMGIFGLTLCNILSFPIAIGCTLIIGGFILYHAINN